VYIIDVRLIDTNTKEQIMKIALVAKHFDSKKLEAVKQQMETLGTPSIHAVYIECHDMYAALEGCHRIRAAKELGLTPVIIDVEYSDAMASTVLGYDGDDDYTISSICDDAYKSTIIEF
jgi:hypothetical protein